MTKILLVEDDKSLREIYGVRLLAEGYDIVSAGDGEEALAMAIKERPQLIVSDVMMPKISGFDMLDILRSTTETKDIKVIMMTALSSEDQRARGEALGADRYLVKSQVGIEDVVRTVHDVLSDAPVTSISPTKAFGGPIASSASSVPERPVGPQVVPQRPGAVLYPSEQPAPAVPAQPQSETRSNQLAPASPLAQVASTPASPPPAMPQPTAPFSTARPANLGDRIIHPLTPPENSTPDISSLINQELTVPTSATTPQAAASNPAPLPPQASAQSSSGINFEETPRQEPHNSYGGSQPPPA